MAWCSWMTNIGSRLDREARLDPVPFGIGSGVRPVRRLPRYSSRRSTFPRDGEAEAEVMPLDPVEAGVVP